MIKRSGAFDLELDLSQLVFADKKTTKTKPINNFMTIDNAIQTITKQIEVSEFRERTMRDYNLHMNTSVE